MRGALSLATRAAVLTTLLAAGGCQSTDGPSPAPAVLVSADPASMERLKAALARATGATQIELGPGDPMRSSVITVLPRPPSPQEDRSLAMPTLFRLELQGATCSLVREATGARLKLEGVACRAAPR